MSRAVEQIGKVSGALRASVSSGHLDECALQSAVREALSEAAIPFAEEHRFDARSRIDFLTHAGLGIELKVDGCANAVLRQLIRYAQSDYVEALLLVTTRAKHLSMPGLLLGKPLFVHHERSM